MLFAYTFYLNWHSKLDRSYTRTGRSAHDSSCYRRPHGNTRDKNCYENIDNTNIQKCHIGMNIEQLGSPVNIQI